MTIMEIIPISEDVICDNLERLGLPSLKKRTTLGCEEDQDPCLCFVSNEVYYSSNKSSVEDSFFIVREPLVFKPEPMPGLLGSGSTHISSRRDNFIAEDP